MKVHYLATCAIRTYQLTQVRLPLFCLKVRSWRNAWSCCCCGCCCPLLLPPPCLPLRGNSSHLCWEFSVCVCPVQTPKGMVSLTGNKAIHRPLAVQVHIPTQETNSKHANLSARLKDEENPRHVSSTNYQSHTNGSQMIIATRKIIQKNYCYFKEFKEDRNKGMNDTGCQCWVQWGELLKKH